tara:strand:- start:2148 stop:2558 length:411 start_codon:yes stop_codon:yes gene_type:complete
VKKTTIAVALMLTIAIISSTAIAQGPGWRMNGMGPGNSVAASAEYQAFVESTKDIRAEIIADRAEMAALMASDNPDAKQVRQLAERINKNVESLNEKARAQNLGNTHMMGAGMGPGMMGYNMMGPGMMTSNSRCTW